MVLDRDYEGALGHFDVVAAMQPGSAIGPLGTMLALETEMLEHEDFRHDDAFKEAARLARQRLRADLQDPEGWDHLLAGAFYGLRGMHALRKKNYVFSVRKGLAAVRHLERARDRQPGLADIDLGLGAYTYFRARLRTVIPWSGTPDGRQRGVQQITHAYREGELVSDIAQMALVLVLLDERQTTESISLAQDLLDRHPGNVLARLHLARGLTRRARYAEAVATLEEVRQLAPENPLFPYYLGNAHYRSQRDFEAARSALEDFVERAPSTTWRAAGLERLGDVHLRRLRPDAALRVWSEAQQLRPRSRVAAKMKRARTQLDASSALLVGPELGQDLAGDRATVMTDRQQHAPVTVPRDLFTVAGDVALAQGFAEESVLAHEGAVLSLRVE